MRYEELRNKKKPSPFISCFTLSQYQDITQIPKKSSGANDLNEVFGNWNLTDQKPSVNSIVNKHDIFDFINISNQPQNNINNLKDVNKASFQFPEASNNTSVQKPLVSNDFNNPDFFNLLNNNSQQSKITVNNIKDVNKSSFQFPEPSNNNSVQIAQNTNVISNNNQKAPDLNEIINNIYKNEYGVGVNNSTSIQQSNLPNYNNLSAQNQPQGNNPSANKSNQLDEIFNLTKTSNNTNNNNSSK